MQSQSHLSMDEHHINIEGTMNQRLQGIDVRLLPSVNPWSYFSRVHEGLRKKKPRAYDPMVVSIGPYHLQNSKLQAMKEHKLWYLHSLLERINMRVETYIMELERLEDRVRKCYNEPIHLTREEFVEMMLLDGCFIIEFFRQKTDNPKLTVGWMKDRILHDMMLLENQLPFFLLSKLYDMTKTEDDPEEERLMSLMAKSFICTIPRPYLDVKCFESFDPPEINDLLHLVHALCRPLPRPRILERNTKNKIKDFLLCPVHFLSKSLLMLIRSQINTRDGTQNQDGIQCPMRSAVELQEAGFQFKKDKSTAHLFDITFEDGVMKVPCFSADDSTDDFFRNLIAFEQHSMDIVPKYFTAYVDFMVQLISSKKDVELLRHKGIIQNYLGDDKKVSNLFNNLRYGVTVSYLNPYYSDVRMKVDKHYNKPRNRIRAELMHYFFNTFRGKVISFGGTAMFVLTLLQTINSYENKP